MINKPKKVENSELTEEEKEEKMRKFVKENEKKIKEYGLFKHYEDSRKFMMVINKSNIFLFFEN